MTDKEQLISAISDYLEIFYLPEPELFAAKEKYTAPRPFAPRPSAARRGGVARKEASNAVLGAVPMPLQAEFASEECAEDIDTWLARLEETFSERLFRMMREKGLDETEIYKKAYVDRRHFSKIRNDVDYKPAKKTVLALAIAMELSVDEAKDLLKSAGFALSNSSKFDLIVQYFLEHGIYDMFEINDVLYHFEQPVFE